MIGGTANPLLRLMAVLCMAWLVALGAVPASAQIRLEPCVARPTDDPLTSPYGPKATIFKCEADQSRHGAGDFVAEFHFAPMAAPADDPLVFRMTSVWQDHTRLRFRYADGTVREVAYEQSQASRYLQVGAIYQIPVPRHSAALTGMEVKTTATANLRGVVLGAGLMPRSASESMNQWLIALYAGFAGLSLALIAYNLALWGALRHRFQLIYCAMVGSITAYMFTSSGVAMLAFPSLANHDRLRLNYVLLALSGVTAMWFVRQFFEERVLPNWLSRAIDGLSILAIASSVALSLFAPTGIVLFDRFYFASLGVLICMVFPVLWCAWRKQSSYFWMFILAWSPPIVTSLLRALHGFGFVPYSFWLDNGNLIALAVEALFSSFLITERLRELSNERDSARAGEISALRLANSDPLTGLLNRRAFLEKAIGRTEPHRLLLIDIDRFKAINDRLGHDTGDEVLRKVADVIQTCRPPESLAVRLGGEEFALLIPLSRQDQCTPDTILEAVRRHPMPMDRKVTVSLGYVDGHVDTDERWRRLYRLADTALYRAKADGRDRACRATDFANRSKGAIAQASG